MKLWNRAGAMALALASSIVPTPAQSTPARNPSVPQPSAEDPWRSFSASINAYTQLRERLRAELPGLTVTDKPAEFVNASDALAFAVQRADPKAPRGRFFTSQAASEIRRRLDAYARGHDMRSILAPLPEERPIVQGMRVYTRFPMNSPMPTMPPGLLQQLPPLPLGLEYRLIGRVLILRDSDAALVLDYLPDALSAVK